MARCGEAYESSELRTRQTTNSDRLPHDCLGFFLNLLQVIGIAEALRVDFVNVLGAGGTGGEPSVLCDGFDSADRLAVSGRRGQNVLDLLAGEL